MKIIKLIIVCCFFTLCSYGQESSFSAVSWKYNGYNSLIREKTSIEVVFQKDTVIEEKTMREFKQNYFTCGYFQPRDSVFYLYPDKDKIYYQSSNLTNGNFLIADFGKKVGESWYSRDTSNSRYYKIQVDSISKHLLGNLEVKSFHVTYFLISYNSITKSKEIFYTYCSTITERVLGEVFFQDLRTEYDDCNGGVFLDELVEFKDSVITLNTQDLYQGVCKPNPMTGLAKVKSSKQIFCSPNPSSDILYVVGLENEQIQSAQLFSLAGEEIFGVELKNSALDVSKLNEGVYFLKLNLDQGVQTLKFVKER